MPAQVKDLEVEAARALPTGAKVEPPPLAKLGWNIFRWLILLFAGVLILLALFAVATYPRLSTVKSLVPAGTDQLKAWRDTRGEWISQIRDVAQLGLFGSLLPLIGSVVGYIFGQHTSSKD